MISAQLRSPSILAFNDPWHDSSFYFSDAGGQLHVESERFTRRKYECINPMVTFSELHGSRVDSFDAIAVQVNVELADFMLKLLAAKHGEPQHAGPPPMPFVDRWLSWCNPANGRTETQAIGELTRHMMRADVPIYLCGHHAAHAANAYYSSPFEEALIVTLDGGGRDFAAPEGTRHVLTELEYLYGGHAQSSRIYGAVYEARGSDMRLVKQLREFSIGEIWNRALTKLLDLKEGEEGTAMAMAALGDPGRFAEDFARPFASYPEVPFLAPRDRAEVEDWLSRLRERVSGEQDRFDVAAAMQLATEQRVREFLSQHIAAHHTNLCLAGGVFLNCQIMGKIRHWFPQLRGVYIPPAPYDGGLSIGAAQMVQHEVFGRSYGLKAPGIAPFAMGESYARTQVLAALESAQLPWDQAGDEDFVRGLADGKVIALFQGSAESGRRALGHRSIVAHPGLEGLKERINAVIKRRLWFRPFAPMVLAEHVHEWFDCEPGFSSPYMSFAISVRPGAADTLRNVVHIDGTARVQTVHRELSPRMYHLLTLWAKASGVPVLLNTSFNDNEPIVETPGDAIRTFLRAPIDMLYFADHGILLRRKGPSG